MAKSVPNRFQMPKHVIILSKFRKKGDRLLFFQISFLFQFSFQIPKSIDFLPYISHREHQSPLSWKCRRRVVSARPPIWHVSCQHANVPATCEETCPQHEQCHDLLKTTSEDICPDALASQMSWREISRHVTKIDSQSRHRWHVGCCPKQGDTEWREDMLLRILHAEVILCPVGHKFYSVSTKILRMPRKNGFGTNLGKK